MYVANRDLHFSLSSKRLVWGLVLWIYCWLCQHWTLGERNTLPGGIFLVFFWDEEPDKLSVAHAPFPLHWVPSAETGRTASYRWENTHTSKKTQDAGGSQRLSHVGYSLSLNTVNWNVWFLTGWVVSYLVTAPEKSRSMILFDEAEGDDEHWTSC